MLNCKFNFIRNCQAVFQDGYNILHYHKQFISIPVANRQHHYLTLSVILTLTIPLMCSDISLWFYLLYLTDNDIKQFVMYLCTVYVCPLVKCKTKFCTVFYKVVLLLSVKSSLYILETSSLSSVCCANILSQSAASQTVFLR